MTYCTPYLLSLGMSKSRMSLVWIAGPLSGLITQPMVGMWSDKCRSKYGRRRPYMLGGTVAVAMCYLVLGWTKEIVAYFFEDAELVWYCSTPFSTAIEMLMHCSDGNMQYCLQSPTFMCLIS